MSIFFCASHGHQEDSDYVGCVDLGDGRAVCNERAPDLTESAPLATPTSGVKVDWPEREQDIAWLSEKLARARHDETQEWVVDEGPMLKRQRYERILAALTQSARAGQ